MIRLDVPHMKTQECRATIMSTLMGVDPTALCDVDMDARRVQVESRFPPSDFIEALEEVGYSSFIAQV
jgi:copper chaperone CopZ